MGRSGKRLLLPSDTLDAITGSPQRKSHRLAGLIAVYELMDGLGVNLSTGINMAKLETKINVLNLPEVKAELKLLRELLRE